MTEGIKININSYMQMIMKIDYENKQIMKTGGQLIIFILISAIYRI